MNANEPPDNDEDETVSGNLPVQLTKLLGRDELLTELRTLVWRTRLLTLCGPGGAGKSRLAVALAEAVRADFVAGAWWVDLSATLDPGLVAQVVAAAVLLGEPANDPSPTAIARRFAESALLVLDNCEQVADGCAELTATLLVRCPALRIVATSRQPLGVGGEQVWRVPGLAVATSTGTEGARESDGGAVELFLERAQEAASSFDPDAPGVRDTVARICAWLEGMPLAIELAASRVPVLGVEQIAQRLEHDSSFLRQSSRTAPARHLTLEATLEWSDQMLEPAEQRLFRRLGVFRGTFSLPAAEAVCSDDVLAPRDVLGLLSDLADRSLVQVSEHPEAPRYKLLATVRQYAAEKLADSGELAATRERHAHFFYELARDLRPGLPGNEQLRWLERIELENDNMSEALQWQLDEAAQDAAGLATLLWPFWYLRGYYREARTWLEQILRSAAEIPASARADVLVNAGEVAFLQCDYGPAIKHLQAALELTEELGERRATATALQRLGSIAREQGRYAEARDLHTRSLAIWEQSGDRHGAAASRNYLGFVAWLENDPASAESLCTVALHEFQRTQNLQEAAETLVHLGTSASNRGELPLAAERLDQALTISRKLGFQEGIAWSLHELAILGRRRRRPPRENAAALRDALVIHQQLGDRWRVASVLEEIAGGVLVREDPRHAVELLGAAAALRERLGAPIPPAETPDRDVTLTRLEAKLRPATFAAAWSQGCERELDEAVDLAVAAIDSRHTAPAHAVERELTPVLTRRELAVLELLSEGHTNREIAAALYISPSTAGVHVSNILRKLGAKRRADAARLAHKLGLLPTH